MLKNLRKSNILNLDLEETAQDLYLDYEFDKNKKSLACFRMDDLGPDGGYLNRMPGNALKLAMLHRISRFITEEMSDSNNPATIVIEMQDMEWAIGKMERSQDHFYRMIARWKEVREGKPNTIMIKYAAISIFISNYTDGWVTRKELVEVKTLVIGDATDPYGLINDLIANGYLIEFDLKGMDEAQLLRHGINIKTTHKGKGLKPSPSNPLIPKTYIRPKNETDKGIDRRTDVKTVKITPTVVPKED